ncbi:hypothetical protein F441_17614 [Phytophthora nicotianae CJ01A1]|uniref:Uncharacterized protein n=1 Tax=Phytophthora nicotianae CJ01A1 TaxID=1317063 RepID=W2W5M3_PHYNI|nr:hypothetical protein F441_17614 [Phytophthora nicotianae CJ01A1]
MAVEVFLWTLCVFKHYATCNNYALDFGFKLPTSEQLVHRVMDICKPVLRQPFDISLSMRDQPSNGRVFANNPYALYAADVKFQFALRLSRRFEEARREDGGYYRSVTAKYNSMADERRTHRAQT